MLENITLPASLSPHASGTIEMQRGTPTKHTREKSGGTQRSSIIARKRLVQQLYESIGRLSCVRMIDRQVTGFIDSNRKRETRPDTHNGCSRLRLVPLTFGRKSRARLTTGNQRALSRARSKETKL